MIEYDRLVEAIGAWRVQQRLPPLPVYQPGVVSYAGTPEEPETSFHDAGGIDSDGVPVGESTTDGYGYGYGYEYGQEEATEVEAEVGTDAGVDLEPDPRDDASAYPEAYASEGVPEYDDGYEVPSDGVPTSDAGPEMDPGLAPVYVDPNQDDESDELPTQIHRDVLEDGIPRDDDPSTHAYPAVDPEPIETEPASAVVDQPPIAFEKWVEVEQALAVFVEAGHDVVDILNEFEMSEDQWDGVSEWWTRYLQTHGTENDQMILKRYAQLQNFYHTHYSGALGEGS